MLALMEVRLTSPRYCAEVQPFSSRGRLALFRQSGAAGPWTLDPPRPRTYTARRERVAQVVEHLTFNQVVVGSSPTALTNS
jgi:hypothetical protein